MEATGSAKRTALARLEQLERRTRPFAVAPPCADVARVRWGEPELVGGIVFRTFTSAGRARHTAWRGLREDRKPNDVIAPGAMPAPTVTRPTPTATDAAEHPEAAGTQPTQLGEKVTVQVENRRLTISNLGKVLYPQAGSPKAK
ncbi:MULTISPECIES: ATP dependent DNA ligase [unclassified Amycolatopsis]|uniref:ATP dependent DNA ligase n=1 Tax=unclassified Amycolatopsis TaxID=2618356 RepID=UPI002E22B47A|nr:MULTISPECIES: hypothetical protein [unclassified Amycolatopsis]